MLARRSTLKTQKQGPALHNLDGESGTTWMALECARMAREILGANGIADDTRSCAT